VRHLINARDTITGELSFTALKYVRDTITCELGRDMVLHRECKEYSFRCVTRSIFSIIFYAVLPPYSIIHSSHCFGYAVWGRDVTTRGFHDKSYCLDNINYATVVIKRLSRRKPTARAVVVKYVAGLCIHVPFALIAHRLATTSALEAICAHCNRTLVDLSAEKVQRNNRRVLAAHKQAQEGDLNHEHVGQCSLRKLL